MKSLSFLKKIFSFVLLGALTFACNSPTSDEVSEKKDVVSEDKVDSESSDVNGE